MLLPRHLRVGSTTTRISSLPLLLVESLLVFLVLLLLPAGHGRNLAAAQSLSSLYSSLSSSSSSQTVLGVISHDTSLRFCTLVTTLTATGLTDSLNNELEGPYTLLAPTNQAFAASNINVTRLLELQWDAHLTDLLLYHVVFGALYADDFASVGQQVPTMNSESFQVTSAGYNKPLMINNYATVVERDYVATNGMVHVLNHVLLPISASQSIYDYVKFHPDYSILAGFIEVADLDHLLKEDPGPYTIFAPTNQAFQSLMEQDAADYDAFVNDYNRIRCLLLYHILPGNVFASGLRQVDSVESLQGSTIAVSSSGNDDYYEIFLNGHTKVIYRDTLVKNGVFHTIDQVLTVPKDITNPTLAALIQQQEITLSAVFLSVLRKTGLYDLLNNPSVTLTVFESTNDGFYPAFRTYVNDEAFHGHLKAAMEYQIVQGDGINGKAYYSGDMTQGVVMETLYRGDDGIGDYYNYHDDDETFLTVTQGFPSSPIIVNSQASVTQADIAASNGVLHVTDSVLLPYFHTVDVIDVIARQPREFGTLVYLFILAKLIPDLSTEGPFTIFAPTNKAFADLLSFGMLSGSDWTSNLDTMREILLYHVVPQVVYAEDLVHGATFPTLQGGTISVSIGRPPVTVHPLYRGRRRQLSVMGQQQQQHGNDNDTYDHHQLRHRQLEEEEEVVVVEEEDNKSFSLVTLLDGHATVLETDMLASNGVVHSIDAVLIPFQDSATENISTPAPDSSNNNEVCIQWGDFEGICCPTTTTGAATTTAVTRQSATEWYCDYIGV